MNCPDKLEGKLCILLSTRSMDFFDQGRFELADWDKYLSALEIIPYSGFTEDLPEGDRWEIYIPSGSRWWVRGYHSIPKSVAEKSLILGCFPCRNS